VGERIVERLRPLGPCNVQLRGTTPFELNVRFSGTTPMRARLGFREVEEALRHFVLGEPARELERPTEGVVLRYWNEIYVPAAQPGTLSQREGLDAPEGLVEDWGM
jgi:carbamoyl-phosphate synthase large subunit